jgi:hypothetical protein
VHPLDNFEANFTSDVRNVCIRLVTYGFDLFSTNSVPYSYWPIFDVLYDLSHFLCMKYEFIFICLIVPGLDHPRTHLNVMLKPLIEDLK